MTFRSRYSELPVFYLPIVVHEQGQLQAARREAHQERRAHAFRRCDADDAAPLRHHASR